MKLPATIREMLDSRAFQTFQESKLGNDLFISDPDRAERIHDAAEDGCDGSTHAEHIDDWREFVDDVRDDAMRQAWNMDADEGREAVEHDVEAWHDKITQEIDACEAWHEANGSLHEQVG